MKSTKTVYQKKDSEADIFLKYGVGPDNQLVYIDQVPRGRTGLKCPYCGIPLVARKGQIKVAHFAHDGPTCIATGRDPEGIGLPAYDDFNLRLPGKVIQALRRFAIDHDYSYRDLEMLLAHELITENEWNRGTGYDLTHKGKIPLGQLSLDLFNKFQEPLIAERHNQLDRAAFHAYQYRELPAQLRDLEAARNALDRKMISGRDEYNRISNEIYRLVPNVTKLDPITALIDLQIYRHQWQRILSNTLYFLKIGADNLYKIGVTTRPIEERVSEIEADLIPHMGKIKIGVVGTWAARGNVELYFKYCYAAQHEAIGNLTEYFRFEDVKRVILDLRRMGNKALSPLENEVLARQPAPAEIEIAALRIDEERRAEQARIEAEQQAQREQRSAQIRAGMQRIAASGGSVGRPKGSHETNNEFMQKPVSQAIRTALDEGLSIRQVAARLGVSINTVQKVKRAKPSA